MSSVPMHHYNPDWLNDDDLAANFVARQEEFAFLRNELARTPRQGGAQHYLLVGVRGAGKTTLLKRLAVSIRRDNDLNDHLIALSFPEELYQVKHLADFWWAACEALADELDRDDQTAAADQLLAAVDQAKGQAASDDALADDGLRLLLETCAGLERRPVLLVDNLDLVFQRIEKTGRKLKNPHAPAYWSFREALSTAVSPVVIGGSVRLSEPFTDYDKAFYDFFLPKRLGKLPLNEVRRVLERLAEARGLPEIRERLQARPGRLEALHELTGGNPRALGLIFELLRQGPNSRAVEDFERLMDSATPYYKARFEDLSDQAQVVMHALAVRRPGDGQSLRFGHTAAEIGSHARLPTNTVSAQLDILAREGLVEKNAAHGRTQYRIAEQLFRLWLQMRGNRRLRQNVIGLTEFLEALFEPEELRRCLYEDTSAVEWANVAGAIRRSHCFEPARQALEQAAQRGEVSRVWYERGALLAATQDEPHETEAAYRKAIELDPADAWSWYNLGNLLADKLKRPQEAEAAYHTAIELDPADFWPWYDLGFLLDDKLKRPQEAEAAYRKAIELDPAHAWPWNSLGVLLANKLHRLDEAAAAYRMAIKLDSTDAWSWINLGALLGDKLNRHEEAEAAYRKAIDLDPTQALSWNSLGDHLLANKGNFNEAAAAFARGAALEPDMHPYWRSRYTEVQARIASTAAQQALATGNAGALAEALAHLATQAVDLAAALVSPAFIEDFLAPSLKDAHQAETLLAALRAAGYDRHGRPLLLAYEAALRNSPDILTELEPEVQVASQRLYDRLTGVRGPI